MEKNDVKVDGAVVRKLATSSVAQLKLKAIARVCSVAGIGIIAFAIITETVFQWPGMGLLFIQAVSFADVPVMAAYLCLIGLFFVVINLAVDLLYYAVDPRLRIKPL